MHYIKLLRPPIVEQSTTGKTLKLSLSITTDLGDAFLSPSKPVEIAVIGAYKLRKDGKDQLVPVVLSHTARPWRSGMRALKFDVVLPPQPITTVQIRPAERQLAALGTPDVCPARQGLIMGVYADISLAGASPPSVCFRSFRLGAGDTAPPNVLQVEEDLGDSIARHIWDSGVVTIAMISDMLLGGGSQGSQAAMPLLKDILESRGKSLALLELGCGIGTLGIGLARILSQLSPGRGSDGAARILMTDLPEAEERARANMARQGDGSPAMSDMLNFESLDWEDGKCGVFGDKVASQAWDLVILSDCTYNTDTLLPLVQTLSALAQRQVNGLRVFLSTKTRHSSEKTFFDLMTSAGWGIVERAVLPLPMLDGDAQCIETYLFG